MSVFFGAGIPFLAHPLLLVQALFYALPVDTLAGMPARVWILWLLLLIRGVFYCSLLPLWEGWDEYAHVAWIQHWVDTGTLPRMNDGVSREIDESLRLAPLPRELRWIGPPYLTHEQWWALQRAEREQRRAALNALPPAWGRQPAAHYFQSYEAQQPPLYYWIASIPARFAAGASIGQRVYMLRLVSVALASFFVPVTWLLAREILPERLRLFPVALSCAAPGLVLDISHVSNDALLIPVTAALLWLTARRKANGTAAGLVLGAALLVKASALVLLPAIVVLWWKRARRALVIALVVAAAVAGWWYARNLFLGLPVSGWLVDYRSHNVFAGLMRISWLAAADTAAKSFLWFGGWSFLTLKAWMYRIPEALGACGVIGLLVRRPPRLMPPLAVITLALGAYGWGILVYFSAQNIANLPGWYLWPFAPAIFVVLTAGLGSAAIALTVSFAALDLYGASTLMAPYYAGLVPHNHGGLQYFFQAAGRLGLAWPLVIAWIAATAAIPLITFPGSDRR